VQEYLGNLNSAVSAGEGPSLPADAVDQIFESALSVLPAASGSTGGGGAESPAPAADSVAKTATFALELASTVLAAATVIDTDTATDAAGVLDFVLSSEKAVSSASASAQVASSITAIGDAVLLGATPRAANASVAVVISTANLNITAEKRLPAEIARKPATCLTETEPATVELPDDILSGLSVAGEVDASQPIDFIFFSSAVNLHGPPPVATSAASSSEGRTGRAAPNATLASPLISFSLRQAGRELKVEGTRQPISISVPLRKGTNTSHTCIGQPANASAAGCTSAFECRYWDERSGEWSGDGCRTKAGSSGAVVCECDHLTDFVVFEFPTTWDALASDVLSGFNLNGLSLEAFTCLARPSISENPFLWTVNSLMLVLTLLVLWRTSERDRVQIDTIQLLVQGRMREREQRMRRAAQAFEGAVARARGSVARSSVSSQAGAAGRLSQAGAAGRLTHAVAALKQGRGGWVVSDALMSGSTDGGASAVPEAAGAVVEDAELAMGAAAAAEGDTIELEISAHEVDCIAEDGVLQSRRRSIPRLLLPELGGRSASKVHPMAGCGTSSDRTGPSSFYRSLSDWMRSPRAKSRDGDEEMGRCLGSTRDEEDGSEEEAGSEDGAEVEEGQDCEDCAEGQEGEESEARQLEAAGTHVIEDGSGTPRLYTSLSTWLEAGQLVAPPEPTTPIDAKKLWAAARRRSQHVVLARRWHRDVDRRWKQIWLDFKLSHSLLAAVFYRGSPGYTRAQSAFILLNSLALELVVLCMMYSVPSEGPVVINPIKIISSGCVAALICIPGMLLFSWCFTPIAFVRFVRLVVFLPVRAGAACVRCASCSGSARARPSGSASPQSARVRPSPPASPPPSPPAHARPSLPALPRTSLLSLPSLSLLPSVPPSPPPSAPTQSMPGPAPLPAPQNGCEAGDKVQEAPKRSKWQSVAAAPLRSLGSGGRRGAIRGDAKFSYASLDEHLLQLSLRHALRRRDYRCAAAILGTWLLSWAVFLALMLTFSLYACEFQLQREGASNRDELLLSWGWSIAQRFLFNEPAIIVVQKGVPMLFAGRAASVCGSEWCSEMMVMVIDVIVTLFRSLKA